MLSKCGIRVTLARIDGFCNAVVQILMGRFVHFYSDAFLVSLLAFVQYFLNWKSSFRGNYVLEIYLHVSLFLGMYFFVFYCSNTCDSEFLCCWFGLTAKKVKDNRQFSWVQRIDRRLKNA